MSMAYRKTALVHAKSKAMREAIVAATIDTIARAGADKLSTDAVAKRASVAAGSLYTHFADKTEMIAAATAQVLAEDIAAMRESESFAPGPFDLVQAIMVLYARFESPHLAKAMLAAPAYREGIRDELAGILKRAVDIPLRERKTAAMVILAVIHVLYESFGAGAKGAQAAVGYSLRAIDIPNAAIIRALDRYLAL